MYFWKRDSNPERKYLEYYKGVVKNSEICLFDIFPQLNEQAIFKVELCPLNSV